MVGLIRNVILSAEVFVVHFRYAFLLRRFVQEKLDKHVCAASAILLAPNAQKAPHNGAAAT